MSLSVCLEMSHAWHVSISRAGLRNWSQSFGKWKIWSLTTHWNHFVFMVSIPEVRNVLQSQENDTHVTCINISEMDERIDPTILANDRYGHWLHIGTILGSWSPSQESETSSKVKKGFLILSKKIVSHFSTFLSVSGDLATFCIIFLLKKWQVKF